MGNVQRFQAIYFEPDVAVLLASSSGLFVGMDGGALLRPSRLTTCVASTGCGSGRWGTSVVARLQAGMRF